MYNSKYVIPGLVIFVIAFTSPFWYNFAFPAYERPKVVLPEGETQCVESLEFMRANHMTLLNDWRDEVVRHARRAYTSEDGKQWNMSLQNTCMDCHSNKADFCDKCHDANSVSPYCWTCHLEPKGNK